MEFVERILPEIDEWLHGLFFAGGSGLRRRLLLQRSRNILDFLLKLQLVLGTRAKNAVEHVNQRELAR